MSGATFDAEADPRRDWMPPGADEPINGKHSKEAPREKAEDIRAEAKTKPRKSQLLKGRPAKQEADIPRRVYVVPGYIQRAVVTALIGPAGSGKSQLCIAWAVALALGVAFGGFRPLRPMRIALFNVEDDLAEQQARVAAALRRFGATEADLGDRLVILSPERTGILVTIDPATRRLRRTELMQDLLDALDDEKPDLLMLDPLVELHDSEENDNTALRHVAAELRVVARERDMAVLLIHHVRKGNPDPGNQDVGRGASALGGVVRKSFTLYPMTEAEASTWKIRKPQYYFRLDGAKANHDEKNGVEWFERCPIMLDNNDITAAAWPWSPPEDTITPDRTDELLGLVAAGDRGKPWSARLGNYDRSIAHAMASIGITTRVGQEAGLKALFDAGCAERAWKKANRTSAEGLRHPSGAPQVEWLD